MNFSRLVPLGQLKATLKDSNGALLPNRLVVLVESGTSTRLKAYGKADALAPLDPQQLRTDANGQLDVWVPMNKLYTVQVFGVNSQILGQAANLRPQEFTDSFDDSGASRTLTSRAAEVLDNQLIFTADGDCTYTINAGVGAAGFNGCSIWLIDTGTLTVQAGSGVSINGTLAGSSALGTVYECVVIQRIGVDSYAVVGGA